MGDSIRVLPLDLAQRAVTATASIGTIVGWAMWENQTAITFIEFSARGKVLRVTPQHYLDVKQTMNARQEPMMAKYAKVGFLLPIWDEQSSSLTWQPIDKITDVSEVGQYDPLPTTSAMLVTGDGFVVSVLSGNHSEVNADETDIGDDIVTAEEAAEVYDVWMPHYYTFQTAYPCFADFNTKESMINIMSVMKWFFQHHHHDKADAEKVDLFIEHLKTNPADLVGEEHVDELK